MGVKFKKVQNSLQIAQFYHPRNITNSVLYEDNLLNIFHINPLIAFKEITVKDTETNRQTERKKRKKQ